MEGTVLNKNDYPQTYFLEGEACKHFGLKFRTYRRWVDGGETIPGRLKVKGSNYYVIDPVPFHKFLINHKYKEGTYAPKKPIKRQTIKKVKTNGIYKEGTQISSHNQV